MNQTEKMLELIQEALLEFDKPQPKLSQAIRKAIRVARLRNDFDNLYWLELEMSDVRHKWARQRITSEIIPHYSAAEFEQLKVKVGEPMIEARSLHDEDKVSALSVPEIETQLEYLQQTMEGFTKGSKYEADIREMILQLTYVLKRIETRVYDFLSHTEKQLLAGQSYSDIFERNRQFVDIKLSKLSPSALEQLTSAYARLVEGNEGARSQSLLSCRRVLKTVADELYPPSGNPAIGPDGKERKLTDDKYIARLWQFVANRVKGTASGNLLLSGINDLGGRIDRVYELSSKGVHAYVAEFEANQCMIQTYLVLGDILRLSEENSALLTNTDDSENT